MKKYLFFLFCICFIISACDKEYKYVPYDKTAKTLTPISFKASSDSAAYIHALTLYTFQIQKSFYHVDEMDYPLGFSLRDSDNKPVLINSDKKQKWTDKMFRIAFGNEAPKVDTEKCNQLMDYFDITTDEFDKDKQTWYQPKSRLSCLSNSIYLSVYLYFGKTERGLSPLRIKFLQREFGSSDWLYIKKIIFKIDDDIIEYIPDDVKQDHSNYGSMMTEAIDEPVSNRTRKLINAVLQGKSVNIKIVGKKQSVIRELCEDDITLISRTVELYKAMGGLYLTKDEPNN